MPIGAAEYTELVASTLEKIESTLVDQVLTRHPTLDLFSSTAKSDTGRKLVLNLEGDEDDSTVVSDKNGTFATTESNDVIGAAEFEWSLPIISKVRVAWLTLQKNSGKEQLVDLLKAHIEAAKKGHAKKLAQMLHARYDIAEGAAGGPIAGQFYGFDALLGDNVHDAGEVGPPAIAARTIGGITATDADHFWNAHRLEVPLDSATMGAGKIRKVFRHVRNEIAAATSDQTSVTHIIAGRDIFEEYEDSYDDKVRYVDFGEGQSQFAAIKDRDIEIRFDPDCPAKRAYFVDLNTFRFRYLNGNFMKAQPAQQLEGKLDFVTPIASVIGVGLNERRASGVLLRPTTVGGDA